MVRCGSKNEHLKDMCLQDTGIHAQNILTILGSIINMIGGPLYELLYMIEGPIYKIFIRAPKTMRQMTTNTI